MKRVTVIIPVYGVEKYIAETVKSVLAQTYSDFELLIVDDGSRDRSVQICRQFDDSRIRILHQPNSGPAAARNLGISQATGEYVAFLDGDDRWTPDKLARHIEHLEMSPEVGVSFCRSAFINEDSQPLGIYQIISKLDGITLLDLLCRTPIGNGSVPVIRRAVFDKIEYKIRQGNAETLCYFNPERDLHPSEDVECWVRIALTTQWKIAGIPEALTLYRIHSRGFSANLLKKLKSWEYMLREICTYAPEQIAPCIAPAMGYQLRYLARRSVSLRDGVMATRFIHQALLAYPRMLLEQSTRTIQTLAAAYLMRLLPSSFYRGVEAIALKIAGTAQKQQISRETAS